MRDREQGTENGRPPARPGEEGYLLLGAIVAIALVMIALSVAAVKVSFALRREREVESARRAGQYVRAIREFYLKFGRYPGSVDQLVDTNNIRFLRQKYVDPLTGKPDYRLIIVGQNKTTPVGFFGEPLGGLPGVGGVGSGGGSANGAPGNGAAGGVGGIGTASAPGRGAFGSGAGGNTATMGFGGGTAGPLNSASPQGTGTQGTGTQSGGAGALTNSSSPTGSGLTGTGTTGTGPPGSNLGPIMGVGSSATGPAIVGVNGQTSYETWEFLYDPRVERLRQAGQLNQGVGSAGTSGNPAGIGGASSGTGATPSGAPGAGTGGTGTGGAGTGGAGTGGASAQPGNAAAPTQP